MKKLVLTSALLLFFLINRSQVFVVDTFAYTGAVATFVVPNCVDTVFIKAWGAQGGDDGPMVVLGGLGGYAQGSLPVNPGDTLRIYVGGKGTDGPGTGQNCNLLGGFNGGGNTGNTCCSNAGAGAGAGGGGTDVRRGGQTLSDRQIVAGGGGGAGDNQPGAFGGDVFGGNGGTYNSVQATGGTQIAGGQVGGHYTAHACTQGTNGSFGQGGEADGNDGGGGGGGWYGGGGGPNNGGGGGGSGYIGGVIAGSMQSGISSGNGLVVLEYTNGCLGTNELSGGPVKIYPNPANEHVMIDLGKMYKLVSVEIFDLAGKRVSVLNKHEVSTIKMEMTGLSAGMYFVKISAGGQTSTTRIVKN